MLGAIKDLLCFRVCLLHDKLSETIIVNLDQIRDNHLEPGNINTARTDYRSSKFGQTTLYTREIPSTKLLNAFSFQKNKNVPVFVGYIKLQHEICKASLNI